MSTKRQIEICSAGCPACEDAIKLVNNIACESCEVTVLDMQDRTVAQRAKALGIQCIPAVVIEGKLAACCTEGGINRSALRREGIGQTLP